MTLIFSIKSFCPVVIIERKLESDECDPSITVIHISLVQVLNAIPDQDSFYDVADSLEEQGMDRITQRHMERQGADLDLLTQFQIYEVRTWSVRMKSV